MKNGDLSNVVAPRIVVVYEGAVAYLPSERVPEYEKAVKKNNWNAVVNMFRFNSQILDRILFLTWKKNYNISIVTWFPEEMASAIEDKLADLSIPVRSVFSSTPENLARLLPYNPDIVCIYDPVPEHVLTFGSKGYVLTDPNQIGQ